MKITLKKSIDDLLLSGKYSLALQSDDIESFPIEYAYALFLDGQLELAVSCLQNINSIRANWLKELINLIRFSKMESPTYFQIRNFLELDIDLMIVSQKFQYLEKFLNYSKFLSEINKETYKLIGRVLFNNNLVSMAKYYLDLYKNTVYYDPELHFMYARYYILHSDYRNALNSINQCLLSLPEYYPAIKLKSDIIKKIN